MLGHCEVHASDCVECGNCEEACTQHLNIVDGLKDIAAWERARQEEQGAKQKG